LILDSIVDTHNLGALIRTAQCVGISGIIIPKDRAAGPTPGVSKASAGALEHVSLIQAVNLVNIIKELKKKGIWIFGLTPDARQSFFEQELKGPVAIIVGGEEKGIRPIVKKQCDFLVSIPQKGHIDSLNASVAGAVVMYEAFRQRLIL
ncbi:23S rRNA (guanosine(2251)-2'-O)-methyltransferase RlmB, partial [Desulfobacterales bacterium HSG17]|nr:23S rRNA (guanosine(2251)-2'-O)-methyltransferase RlmB [Desulfobacterales bacterium HSG17]